jgi:hypothetical protein
MGAYIMLALLEWQFEISLALASVAATGSVLLLLLELAKVTCKHLRFTPVWANRAPQTISADATS